ncbi:MULTISPECIES: CHAD domain-containing protein [Moorena]|uniref:Metal-binding protein n=1 Tax=Moorena bouillonii PNG TaxID=568701 RepID=A0A1U7NA22_9CYAN|nr:MULTISPECIES: CHAD domain-containing protein [Moorena]NEO16473.1 CHAD domain-containing protein [Moorena sp. SIO3E8]NEQ03001.1 CHAD domain-containing protein [Moorena sp. SIO3F7]OLT62793.1 metal-binding protein [Moorena bouillonii PNG]
MNKLVLPQTKTIGEWSYLGIQKHFQKMLSHEAAVLQDRDPEQLHQMRIGMRRLRTAITSFTPALDLPKAASEKQIGKIARILGSLRDLDVLQETLHKGYQPKLPTKERKALKQAYVYLEKKRCKALTQVREALQGKPHQKLKQTLKRWLKKPTYKEIAQMPAAAVLPDLLLPIVSSLLLHPAWLVGIDLKDTGSQTPKQLKPAAVESLLAIRGSVIHDLRKQAKRVRYQMNLFTELYSPTYKDYVEDMKQIQGILGDIQDSMVLDEFLNSVFHSDLKHKAPQLAELLQANRYKSWQQWQTLQQNYLKPETRQAFRQILLTESGN